MITRKHNYAEAYDYTAFAWLSRQLQTGRKEITIQQYQRRHFTNTFYAIGLQKQARHHAFLLVTLRFLRKHFRQCKSMLWHIQNLNGVCGILETVNNVYRKIHLIWQLECFNKCWVSKVG